MFLALLATLASTAPETAPSRPPWASITKANTGLSVSLELGTLGAVSRTPYRLAYFVRRTSTPISSPSQVSWADSVTCPQLTSVIERLRDVPTPLIDIPGLPGRQGGLDESLQLDGSGYTLSLSGRMSFRTGNGSPLADWTEAALRDLDSCWRSETPRDVG